jgi:hypothetical protein
MQDMVRCLDPTQSSLRTEQNPRKQIPNTSIARTTVLIIGHHLSWLVTTVGIEILLSNQPAPLGLGKSQRRGRDHPSNVTRPQSRAHRLNHAATHHPSGPGTRFLGARKTMFHAARFAGSRQVGLSAAHGRFATKAARGEFGRPCIKVGGPQCVGARRVKSTVGKF